MSGSLPHNRMKTAIARQMANPRIRVICRSTSVLDRKPRAELFCSFSSRAAELSSLISSSPFWSVATIYVLIADMCMIFSNLLYRHVHDGLVGIDHLVAHLYRCLEGDRGFLAGDHHIGQIDGLVAHI